MGNLKKYMPSTHMTFFLSTLAIAGIPGLSGFFSKDEIMTMNFLNGMDGQMVYFIIWGVGMLTAFLTAFYMTRVYFLTFRGKERFPHEKHPHESDAFVTIPLWILAILAAVGGYLGIPAIIGHGKYHSLNNWLGIHGAGHGAHEVAGHGAEAVHHGGAITMAHVEHIEQHASVGLEAGLIGFSILIAVLGVLLAWRLYAKHDLAGDAVVKRRLGRFYKVMQNKFYFDEIYEAILIKPFVWLGQNFVMAFDKFVIDGIVNGVGNFMLFLGDGIKTLQSGLVGQYALMIVIGVVFILGYLIIG